MAVGYRGFPDLGSVAGIRIGVASAGIKRPGRRDLVLFELAPATVTAALFTRNAFCAAPVTLAKRHLAATAPRYLLINTGNANAGTGIAGLTAATRCCQALAAHAGCAVEAILPFSTGVIGEPLPVEKITPVLGELLAALSDNAWEAAAHGIMTTDTVAKGAKRSIELSGGTITLQGIAKGSGMIRPDMATMLAYVATDAALSQSDLHQALTTAVNQSFNRITVDGDTSTNDAIVAMASGASAISVTSADDLARFTAALSELCIELAQLIIRDGEGATKFITIEVTSGRSEAECCQVAYAIAHSPLVKTALFASDPNWGRILAAVGRAGLDDLDLEAITIHLGDICIVRGGGRDSGYTEAAGQQVMAAEEITIGVDLQRGSASARVWSCDFSYDYVKINAEYRT
jgi:glutamate N-acetyltransferase / amino-acid N-acetyltransferase